MKRHIKILRGYTPEKIYYMSNRNDSKNELELLNNPDITAKNSLIDLCHSDYLSYDNEYLVINSEMHYKTISENDDLLYWFKRHYDKILMTKTYNFETKYNPTWLADRINVTKLLMKDNRTKGYLNHARLINGKEFNELSDEEKFGHCVKTRFGSGSAGITGFNKGYDIKTLNENDDYVMENIVNAKLGESIALEAICLVTWNEHKQKAEVSFELHRNFWESRGFGTGTQCNEFQVDNTYYYEVKEFLENIVNVLGIKTGVFEPEFNYNYITNHITLFDLNFRWSLDHSTIKERASKWLPKNFDMLDYFINNKPFYKYYEKMIKKGFIKSPMQTWGTSVVTLNKE